MTEDDCAKLLHEAETRVADFLAHFPGLVVLCGVRCLVGHLEAALHGRAECAEALAVLGGLRAFVEGRNALANLHEEEDRQWLRRHQTRLRCVVADGRTGQDVALQLLFDWLAVAGDPRVQEVRLAEVAQRHETWLRGLGGAGPERGTIRHAP